MDVGAYTRFSQAAKNRIALTTFWAMVTIGRVVFASIQRWVPTGRTYHLLPFVLAAALLAIASLPEGSTAAGVVAFGVAGLGCSALLPLEMACSTQFAT